MASREYFESLNIKDNVFELNEDIIVSFLVHFSLPLTGGSKINVPKGTKFASHGPMNHDTLYMHLVEHDEDLLKQMDEQEKKHYERFASRLGGYSFYITEEEIKNWNINFISGSRKRLLEVLRLIRESNHKRK